MVDPKDKSNKDIEALTEKMGLESCADEEGLRGVRSELDDEYEEKNVDVLMEEKNKLDDDFVKPDLDAIEKRIDEMEDDIIADDCDREEPMTTDRKIHMLSKIFAFAIGDRIKNLLDEEGIVDLVGLDRRGVLYLVQYKENNMRWEQEQSITKSPYKDFPIEDKIPTDPTFKTDIPDKKGYTGEHRIG